MNLRAVKKKAGWIACVSLVGVAMALDPTSNCLGSVTTLEVLSPHATSLPRFQETERPESTPDSETQADSTTTTVGFPKVIFQHKIAGSQVIVKPLDDRTIPVVVRIVETYPHGSDFRYDIEYKGLEPGTFDLADYLQRDDESDVVIPSLRVKVNPILEPDEVRPYSLTKVQTGYTSFYMPLMLVVGAVWIAGLLLIVFYGRGKLKRPTNEQKILTVADRLRPLVDAAIEGELTTQQQAELERVLSGFWSKKLRLSHLSAEQLRARLREHPDASVMLKQIDLWLHQPPGSSPVAVDVTKLLAPYQAIDDDTN